MVPMIWTALARADDRPWPERLWAQGVVLAPYQPRFDQCLTHAGQLQPAAFSGQLAAKASRLVLYNDGSVLLHGSRHASPLDMARVLAAFNGCIRRYGQQR